MCCVVLYYIVVPLTWESHLNGRLGFGRIKRLDQLSALGTFTTSIKTLEENEYTATL